MPQTLCHLCIICTIYIYESAHPVFTFLTTTGFTRGRQHICAKYNSHIVFSVYMLDTITELKASNYSLQAAWIHNRAQVTRRRHLHSRYFLAMKYGLLL